MLRDYLEQHHYPVDDVPHEFMSLEGSFRKDLERAKAVVRGWLGEVDAARRTEVPASELRIGLQCGGSDAFSGVSANPLVAWVSREVVRNGGSANLAETDELIGAERYVLENVRDLETARRFLSCVERFKERVSWHGHTAEDNPSGRQQLSRALQHLHQVHRGGHEEAPRRAHRPGDRVRPEDGGGRLLLHGQPG